MSGPAEIDEMGQEGSKLLMRANMTFGALAEHDARRREAKARRAAEQDKHAAKIAQAKAQAARQVAEQKLRTVLDPQWKSSLAGRQDRDDMVVDAARTATNFQGLIPIATAALAKVRDFVESEYGVPLEQWTPNPSKPLPDDIEAPETSGEQREQDSTIEASAAIDAMNRRDRAEAGADHAQQQARHSAADADKASEQARTAEADAGLTRLPHPQQAQPARTIGTLSASAASAVTPGFARAVRAVRAAMPAADTPTVGRATNTTARKGRTSGPGQGRTHERGM